VTKDLYIGMTKILCADACNENGCVITGKPYCGHPMKSALHQAEMLNKDVLARRLAAKVLLIKADSDEKIAGMIQSNG
jgi:hypothetical protein